VERNIAESILCFFFKFSAGNQEQNYYFVVLQLSTDHQQIAAQDSLGMNVRAMLLQNH